MLSRRGARSRNELSSAPPNVPAKRAGHVRAPPDAEREQRHEAVQPRDAHEHDPHEQRHRRVHGERHDVGGHRSQIEDGQQQEHEPEREHRRAVGRGHVQLARREQRHAHERDGRHGGHEEEPRVAALADDGRRVEEQRADERLGEREHAERQQRAQRERPRLSDAEAAGAGSSSRFHTPTRRGRARRRASTRPPSRTG